MTRVRKPRTLVPRCRFASLVWPRSLLPVSYPKIANISRIGAYPVCPGTPGIFNCQIRLTEDGLKNYKEIVKVFFQYVSLLRETPPQEWIFEEQKGLADVDFKFKQKTPASRFTSKISAVMQTPLPREWLLSGHST